MTITARVLFLAEYVLHTLVGTLAALWFLAVTTMLTVGSI